MAAAGLQHEPFLHLQKACATRHAELLQREAHRLLHHGAWLTGAAGAAADLTQPLPLADTVDPAAWEQNILCRLDTLLLSHCAAERRRRRVPLATPSVAAAASLTFADAERELRLAVLGSQASVDAVFAELGERQRVRTLALLLSGALRERLRAIDSVLVMAESDDVTRDLRAVYAAQLKRLAPLVAKKSAKARRDHAT